MRSNDDEIRRDQLDIAYRSSPYARQHIETSLRRVENLWND